jgi:hypothetical protein
LNPITENNPVRSDGGVYYTEGKQYNLTLLAAIIASSNPYVNLIYTSSSTWISDNGYAWDALIDSEQRYVMWRRYDQPPNTTAR